MTVRKDDQEYPTTVYVTRKEGGNDEPWLEVAERADHLVDDVDEEYDVAVYELKGTMRIRAQVVATHVSMTKQQGGGGA